MKTICLLVVFLQSVYANIRVPDSNAFDVDDAPEAHMLPVQLDSLGGVKRAMSMLRMGRATASAGGSADEQLAAKKAMGMLRMGRTSVGGLEDNKRAMGMLRMGRRQQLPYSELYEEDNSSSYAGDTGVKRAMSMLRMGRRAMGMLRMGRQLHQSSAAAENVIPISSSDKKAMSMLRMG